MIIYVKASSVRQAERMFKKYLLLHTNVMSCEQLSSKKKKQQKPSLIIWDESVLLK